MVAMYGLFLNSSAAAWPFSLFRPSLQLNSAVELCLTFEVGGYCCAEVVGTGHARKLAAILLEIPILIEGPCQRLQRMRSSITESATRISRSFIDGGMCIYVGLLLRHAAFLEAHSFSRISSHHVHGSVMTRLVSSSHCLRCVGVFYKGANIRQTASSLGSQF